MAEVEQTELSGATKAWAIKGLAGRIQREGPANASSWYGLRIHQGRHELIEALGNQKMVVEGTVTIHVLDRNPDETVIAKLLRAGDFCVDG